jgi:hypothetical protein
MYRQSYRQNKELQQKRRELGMMRRDLFKMADVSKFSGGTNFHPDGEEVYWAVEYLKADGTRASVRATSTKVPSAEQALRMLYGMGMPSNPDSFRFYNLGKTQGSRTLLLRKWKLT